MAIQTVPILIKISKEIFLNCVDEAQIFEAETNIKNYQRKYSYVFESEDSLKVKEELDGWIIKLHLKFLYINYVNNFSKENEFLDYLNNTIQQAQEKGYKTILKISNAFKQFVEAFHPIFEQYQQLASKINNLDYNYNTQECEIINQQIDNYIEKFNNVKKILDDVFGNEQDGVIVKLPNNIAKIKENLENYKKKLTNRVNEIRFEKYSKYIRKLEQIYPDNPLYYPELGYGESNIASIVVVNSPIRDEVLLSIKGYCLNKKINMLVLDIVDLLVDINEKDIEELFLYISTCFDCEGLFIENLNELHTINLVNKLFEEILSYASNHIVFLSYEKSDGKLYDELFNYIMDTQKSSTNLIRNFYLSMPDYGQFIQELEKNGIIDFDNITEKETIKRNMPFTGFVGLNEIIRNKNNWFEIGKNISSSRDNLIVRNYIKKLNNQRLFINNEWGSFSENEFIKTDNRGNYDYDSISTPIRDNIKKIINCPCDFFSKVGMAVQYCLTAGQDISIWTQISLEEKEKRTTEATNLVYLLLGISFKPEIKFLETLEEKNTLGLCCNEGREIHYKSGLVKTNVIDLMDTILHESYHAFQHHAISNKYYEYYFTDLGVTHSRINTWNENFKKYISPDKNKYDYYSVQIVESDARAFAQDCIDACQSAWSTIDFD